MPFSDLLSLDNWICKSDCIDFECETELFALTGVLSAPADVNDADDMLLIVPFDERSTLSMQNHKKCIYL